MKKRLQRLIGLGALGFLVCCGSGWCFTVSPSRVEIALAPSQKDYSGTFSVKNAWKGSVDVTVRAEDWFKTSRDPSWLQIEPLAFELKEGQAKEVRYRVAVPKKAKGELSAMVFIEGRPKGPQEAAISVNTSIGVPVYAVIKGTQRYKAAVTGVRVMNAAPLVLAVEIRNTGNVHIRPEGSLTVKTKKGKEMLTVPLNEYNYPVLPGSSRILEIRSDHRLGAGEYLADVRMRFADKKYNKKIAIAFK